MEIEEFFGEVSEFKSELQDKGTKTIHTDDYVSSCRTLYAQWKKLKPHLSHFLEEEHIGELDFAFEGLFDESRRSNSRVKNSASYLEEIEDIFYKHLSYKLGSADFDIAFTTNLLERLPELEDEKFRGYLGEAIQCVQARAYRGAVVLGWQAVMYATYKELAGLDEPFHVIYQKKFGHTPKVEINDFWDFQKLKDKDVLILAEHNSLIDKGLKDIVTKNKTIRDKAAHPGRFDVGPNSVKAFLEQSIEFLVKMGPTK